MLLKQDSPSVEPILAGQHDAHRVDAGAHGLECQTQAARRRKYTHELLVSQIWAMWA
jgi:hypothetical protein